MATHRGHQNTWSSTPTLDEYGQRTVFVSKRKKADSQWQAIVAFARGVSSVYRLHAHSDEGGYARNACRCVDYPEPRGWVSSNTNSELIPEFSKFALCRAGRIRADVLGLLVNNEAVNTMKSVTNGSTDLALAVRNSIANLMPTEVEYDTRAMMYMIGREMSRALETNGKLVETCDIFPVTSLTLNIGQEEFIYSPPRRNGSLCVTVVGLIAKACHKRRVVIVAEEASRFDAENLLKRDYLTGLVTIANQFLMDAKMTGMFGQASLLEGYGKE